MKISKNEDLEILGFSDSHYEKLTAEIQFKGEPIAQINQDKGENALELEIFTDYGKKKFEVKLPLEDFLRAIDCAKKKLVNE